MMLAFILGYVLFMDIFSLIPLTASMLFVLIPLLLVLGMGGMFAATVRAPLTGAALVVEMARCPLSAPAVLLTAVTASLVASRLGGEPVYDSLKRRILRRRALQAEATPVESVK